MLNIEKHKNTILAKDESDITCCVRHVCLGEDSCMDDCYDCKKQAMQWLLSEYKKPILNDSEKKYLGAIIRPFRNEVEGIYKSRTYCGDIVMYSIQIVVALHTIVLPLFPIESHMYEGLYPQKEYTLEELGL